MCKRHAMQKPRLRKDRLSTTSSQHLGLNKLSGYLQAPTAPSQLDPMKKQRQSKAAKFKEDKARCENFPMIHLQIKENPRDV